MIVRVDPDSPLPPYEQVRAQVATMVTGGALEPGTRLPAIRQLAGDLGLATGTVARAYRELEQDGLVVCQGRRGTRVAPREQWSATVDRTDAEARLREAADAYATLAHQLGVDPTDAVAHVEAAFRPPAPAAGGC